MVLGMPPFDAVRANESAENQPDGAVGQLIKQ
jgi:hypothetical protein